MRTARLTAALLAGATAVTAAASARADGELPPRVTVPQREEESWAFLRDPAARIDPLDALKYISLTDDPAVYLTLGAEAREYLEVYRDELWSPAAGTSASLLQRYLAHADAHLGRFARVFVQLESSLEAGRAGGPHPQVDRDGLDVLQAWAEIAPVPGVTLDQRPRLAVRVGRQELTLGAGRLIAARELNVRAPFDGARLTARVAGAALDAFWLRPIVIHPALFDDAEDRAQQLWGAYATVRLARPLALDAYYLGLDRALGVYARGAGPETRHTLGARLHLTRGALDGDVEAAAQVGAFAGRDIRAWMAVATADVTISAWPAAPTVGLVGAAVSGDSGSGALGTFDALAPRGDHFGAPKLLGPANTLAVDQHVVLHLPGHLTAAERLWVFGRESTRDGLYSIAGFPIPAQGTSDARYVGTQVQAELAWRADAHLTLSATVARFVAGTYLRATTGGADTTYVAAWAAYRI